MKGPMAAGVEKRRGHPFKHGFNGVGLARVAHDDVYVGGQIVAAGVAGERPDRRGLNE
jgi:hypothetical protein